MDIAQIRFCRARIALIASVQRAAITDIVLNGRDHMIATQEIRSARLALQTAHERWCILRKDLGILGVRLVCAAPTNVLRYGDRRRECPFLTRHAQLTRGDLADTLHQLRVARRAECDVVREQCRADDVVVTMNRIDAPKNRNRMTAATRIHRRFIECIGRFEPLRRRRQIVAIRTGVAADENRTQSILAHIIRCHAAQIGLNDLPDFLFDAQRTDELIESRLDRAVVDRGSLRLRPELRMHLARSSRARVGNRCSGFVLRASSEAHGEYETSNHRAACATMPPIDHHWTSGSFCSARENTGRAQNPIT